MAGGRLFGGSINEDRGVATLVYGLYLFGLVNGLTILVGLIISYLNRREAGAALKSHYVFQAGTVWIAAFWLIVGGGMIYGSLSMKQGGLSGGLFLAGWLVCGCVWLWFAARNVLGLIYLSRREPYPRPRSWLI
jgi:uncharacterized membrane protein